MQETPGLFFNTLLALLIQCLASCYPLPHPPGPSQGREMVEIPASDKRATSAE